MDTVFSASSNEYHPSIANAKPTDAKMEATQNGSFVQSLGEARERMDGIADSAPTRPAPVGIMDVASTVAPGTDLQLSIRRSYLDQLARQSAMRMAMPGDIGRFPTTQLNYAGQMAVQVNHAGFSMPQGGHTATPKQRERESAVDRVPPIDSAASARRI